LDELIAVLVAVAVAVPAPQNSTGKLASSLSRSTAAKQTKVATTHAPVGHGPAFASAKSQDKRAQGRAGRPRPLARGGHRSIPGRIRPVSLRVKKLQYMPRPDSRFQPAPPLLGCLASRPRDRRPPCNSEMTATSSSLGSGLHSCIVRGAKCGHRHGSAATARSPPAYRLLRTLSAITPADASLELTSLTHS
jgi:hypothetical protein